eukprot:3763121-Pleurochrysis_carterae.AAC.1
MPHDDPSWPPLLLPAQSPTPQLTSCDVGGANGSSTAARSATPLSGIMKYAQIIVVIVVGPNFDTDGIRMRETRGQ